MEEIAEKLKFELKGLRLYLGEKYSENLLIITKI